MLQAPLPSNLQSLRQLRIGVEGLIELPQAMETLRDALGDRQIVGSAENHLAILGQRRRRIARIVEAVGSNAQDLSPAIAPIGVGWPGLLILEHERRVREPVPRDSEGRMSEAQVEVLYRVPARAESLDPRLELGSPVGDLPGPHARLRCCSG